MLRALLARFRHVPFHVQRQVIRAGKAALADLTLEGLCAGVLAVVAGELIGTGKTPLALGPLAAVRLLACVNALMCLQVRAFGVNLGAAWIVAAVNASLLKFGIVAAIVSRLTAAAVAVAGRGNLSHHGGGIVLLLLLLLSTGSAEAVRNFAGGPRADEALSAAAAAERYGNGATAAAAQVHCICTD